IDRVDDVDPWNCRSVYQIGIALFHKVMNIAWAFRCVHYGSVRQVGTLSFFFSILDKRRLANEKPDFYTLNSAYSQILDGLILNAWRLKCGKDSLDKFIAENPPPEVLHKLASEIFEEFATPLE
ncbi:hypothetical protein MPER_14712, partial [Moniliophthora perniciosa FA553]